ESCAARARWESPSIVATRPRFGSSPWRAFRLFVLCFRFLLAILLLLLEVLAQVRSPVHGAPPFPDRSGGQRFNVLYGMRVRRHAGLGFRRLGFVASSQSSDTNNCNEQAMLHDSPGPHLYFIVGMTNSAPLRIPVGQRVVMVLRCV